MKKRVKNHFGFSLIELVVAFAILGIASLAIGGFFVSSSRSYSTSSSETGVQYEAQMALNQIEGKLIDATLGVNYNLVLKAPQTGQTKYNFVSTDTYGNDVLESKVLYIFDYKNDSFDALLIKWNIATKELLYKEVALESQLEKNVEDIPLEDSQNPWELMAENVDNFSVDLSKYRTTRTVDVKLALKKMSRPFETVGTITLRNNVLVNQSKVSDIYANMSGATKTKIESVILSANTNVTKLGGSVQLSTKVTGVYPSQDIHGWLIAHSYKEGVDVILGNSSTSVLVDDDTASIKEKVLTVKTDPKFANLKALYVQAKVRTGVDSNNNPIYIYSNIVTIYVRNISGVNIWPTANLALDGNKTLIEDPNAPSGDTGKGTPDNNNIVSWVEDKSQSGAAIIYPLNKIDMNYEIQGSKDDYDVVDVKWSVYQKQAGVIVSIDEKTGVLTVDRNSQPGTFRVKAEVGDITNANYLFEVKSQYSSRDTVTVDVLQNMNRGQDPYQCGVKFNGVEASVSDYYWSVVVKTSAGQIVTGDAVEISDRGVLTIKDSLSFDYSYNVFVYARLKSNPDEVFGYSTVYVPRVSIYLTTTGMFTPRIDETIPAGYIVCNVVGLANYDIDWTIAKQTNPDFYFTAYGNTSITGEKLSQGGRVVDTAKIAIGGDEPSTLQFVRVKAAISGHSNYATTMTLYLNNQYGTEEVNYILVSDKTSIQRSQAGTSATITGQTEDGTLADVSRWGIVSVKDSDGNNINYYSSHLTLVKSNNSQATLTVYNGFASSNSGKDLYVEVTAYNNKNQQFQSVVITVPKVESSGGTDTTEYILTTNKTSIQRSQAGTVATITGQTEEGSYKAVSKWNIVSVKDSNGNDVNYNASHLTLVKSSNNYQAKLTVYDGFAAADSGKDIYVEVTAYDDKNQQFKSVVITVPKVESSGGTVITEYILTTDKTSIQRYSNSNDIYATITAQTNAGIDNNIKIVRWEIVSVKDSDGKSVMYMRDSLTLTSINSNDYQARLRASERFAMLNNEKDLYVEVRAYDDNNHQFQSVVVMVSKVTSSGGNVLTDHYLSAGDSSIKRSYPGTSTTISAYKTGNQTANVSRWEIESVKTSDGISVDYNSSDLTLEKITNKNHQAKLTVKNEFALASCGKDIQVTVAAYNANNQKMQTVVVTIPKVEITIENGAESISMQNKQNNKGVACTVSNIDLTDNIKNYLKWTVSSYNNYLNPYVSMDKDNGDKIKLTTNIEKQWVNDYTQFTLKVALQQNGNEYVTDTITVKVTKKFN